MLQNRVAFQLLVTLAKKVRAPGRLLHRFGGQTDFCDSNLLDDVQNADDVLIIRIRRAAHHHGSISITRVHGRERLL